VSINKMVRVGDYYVDFEKGVAGTTYSGTQVLNEAKFLRKHFKLERTNEPKTIDEGISFLRRHFKATIIKITEKNKNQFR